MLPKENRLVSNYEFNLVRYIAKKDSTRFEFKNFVLFYINKRDYYGVSKFGIVVSKHLSKSAVTRNKIKRQFREIIRRNLSLFENNYWVVIHPKKYALQSTYEEISSELIEALQKHHISR